MAIYIGIQLAYCFGLKHQAVLDICIVSSGFLIRAIAGGVAAGIPLSQWFLLVMAFGSLFMAAGKRYAELQLAERTGAKIRKSLESYTSTYLRFVWTLSATAVVLCYGLWAFERDGDHGSWFAISMIPFTIAILRYAVDVDGGLAGEPEEIALRDRVLQLLALAWIGTIIAAVALRLARPPLPPGAAWPDWPAFPLGRLSRISLWVSVLVVAALFGWGAWQRRWIADDGLIVLRTVRNLLAGNGPVFNAGERVESNTSTLWTYLVYLGGLVGGPVRLEYVALALALSLSVAGVVMVMLGTARLYAPEPAGPPGAVAARRRAGLHRDSAGPGLRHLRSGERSGDRLARPAVVDDGLLVAGTAAVARQRNAVRWFLAALAVRRRTERAGSPGARPDRRSGSGDDADRRPRLDDAAC